MSKHLATQIDIAASPQQVWAVLTDLASYTEWNPFIVEAEGKPEVGSRLTLRLQPTTGRAATVRPTVLESREGSRLRWLGRVGVRGIFDADHSFTIAARGGSGSTLHQDETFRGVLVPFFSRSLDRGTRPAFLAMNEALKRRAEESAAVPRSTDVTSS